MTETIWHSVAPATGERLWSGEDGDVDAAVKVARGAAAGWARLPLEQRIAHVTAFQSLVTERAEEFAVLLARETGKPLWEARTEIGSVAAKVDISVRAQAERAGTVTGMMGAFHQAIRHKPHGVMAVLGPYNFPAHLPNGHIVPALLAGNVIVFKPSEQTPATGEFMVQCWHDAGLPAGVVNLVQGRADTGRALAGHTGIDGLLFTGSAATGAKLAAQFAAHPDKMLAIEAGGNNPLIVWDLAKADRAEAVKMLLQSAFISAGQRCTCARRLVLPLAENTLLDDLNALLDRIIIDHPFAQPAPFMGPVIDNRAADGVQMGWQKLIDCGGRIIRPLSRPNPELPFLTPGIIDMTGCPVPDEEIFGPVLQIFYARDFDEALVLANDTAFGLAAGLIGGDRALYEQFWAASRAGVVNWNRPTTGAASSAPFGGVGISGNHRPSAFYAADYCAWPVASLEADVIDAGAITGLREQV